MNVRFGWKPGDYEIVKRGNKKAFDPSQPRDEHGRWTDTGGGDLYSGGEDGDDSYDEISGVPKAHVEAVTRIAKQTAVDQGFDPDKIKIDTSAQIFTVGGTLHTATGRANLKTGEVTVYPAQIFDPNETRGTVTHEIGHLKFQKVYNALAMEVQKVQADPAMEGVEEGKIGPEDAAKYPLLAKFDKHFSDEAVAARIEGDGVTPYSALYWENYKPDDPKSLWLATHETIAEMARMEAATGQLGSMPPAPEWQSYYRDIMSSYAEMSGTPAGEHPGAGYSKQAYVKNGVIHTSDVNDAARALAENKKVELDQPRGLSVLIDKLGEISKEMIEKGEKAPNFNLCNVTLRNTSLFCATSHGIPRVQMPQMTVEETERFVEHLMAIGYAVSNEDQFASYLRATQNELNGAKVAGIANKMRNMADHHEGRTIVSDDDYILDGHHRWAAKVGLDAADNILANDTKIPIARVNISITKLLEEAEKFTGGKGKRDIEDKRARWARLRAQAQALLKGEFIQDPTTGQMQGSRPGGGEAKPSGGGKKVKPTREEFEKDNVLIPKNVQGDVEKTEKFLDAWEKNIGMDPGDFKKAFLGTDKASMEIEWRQHLFNPGDEDAVGDIMVFTGNLLDDKGKFLGTYDREIDFMMGRAHSNYLSFKDVKSGLGKQVLAGNVAMYQKLGIQQVETSANISIGGYAWAKYGYVPTDDSWSELKDIIRDKIEYARDTGEFITPEVIEFDNDTAETILALLETDEPKALWIVSDSEWGKALLLGTSWDGVLDLTDKESMQRFHDYVGRKK